jgi:hypothetical protein
MILALRTVACSELRTDPKTGYKVWDIKIKASDILLNEAQGILKTKGSGQDKTTMINVLIGEGGLRGELSWDNPKALNILLSQAQGIFNSGSPEQVNALFNALEKAIKAPWANNSQINTASELIRKNTEIISEKSSSAKNRLSQIELFTEAKNLNIKNLSRFNDITTMLKVVNERQKGTDPNDTRKLAVLIFSEADSNGAFAQNGVTGEKIKEFIDAGYRVMYYEISEVKQIAECFKDACGEKAALNRLISLCLGCTA